MSNDPRLASAEDRPAIEALVNAAYSHYVPRIGLEPGPMRDDYAPLIQAGRVYVLDRGDTIVGVLVLVPEKTTLLLDNIAIAPAAQGTGLGRKLLVFAEQTARAMGYRSIRLYTSEMMTENIGLYTRIGYVETHRGEEIGLRRVYMTKKLD